MNRIIKPLIVTIIFFTLIGFAILSTYITDFVAVKNSSIPKLEFDGGWELNFTNEIITTPLVADGNLFIQTSNDVYSYNLSSHTLNWKTEVKGDNHNCPMFNDDKNIYVPNVSGLAILDIDTGKNFWTINLDDQSIRIEDIVANNDYLFFSNFSTWLYAYDKESQEMLWKKRVEDRSFINLLLFENNVIVNSAKDIISYNMNSGTMVWKKNYSLNHYVHNADDSNIMGIGYESDNYQYIEIDKKSGKTISTIALDVKQVKCIEKVEEYLLISGYGLMLYDKNNSTILWENNSVDQLTCPIVLGEKIFSRKEIRDLYEFDLLTGQFLGRYNLGWRFGIPSRHPIVPIKYENIIVLPSGLKQVVIYKLE